MKNPLYNAPIIEDLGVEIDTNFEPIIEVFSVNPNQLIYTDTPPPDEQGSLTVQ